MSARQADVADVIAKNMPYHYDGSADEAMDAADAVLNHLAAPVELEPAALEAMNDLAVVMDDDNDVWQYRGGVWCSWESSDHSSTRLARYGPFRILYTGKATS